MNLSKYERETVITFNDEENTASVYTCNKSLMKKLDKICGENHSFRMRDSNNCSATYILPKRQISIRAPRVMSEETKSKLSIAAKERFSR